MNVSHEGRCGCGAPRNQLARDPLLVHCCHGAWWQCVLPWVILPEGAAAVDEFRPRSQYWPQATFERWRALRDAMTTK